MVKKENDKEKDEIFIEDFAWLNPFFKEGILTKYLMAFCCVLLKDRFLLVPNTYIPNIDYSNFICELEKQLPENEKKKYKSFHCRGLKIPETEEHPSLILGLKTDIFFQENHVGIILAGVNTPIREENVSMKPHFIVIVREGKEKKISQSKTKTYRQLFSCKDIKFNQKNQEIEDSLNPKKFPLIKIDVSKFENQEFFELDSNCCW